MRNSIPLGSSAGRTVAPAIMDKNVIRSKSERFTLWLDGHGKPVERAVSEMTAGDVIEAMRWHRAEANRLAAEAGRATANSEPIIARGTKCEADAAAVRLAMAARERS